MPFILPSHIFNRFSVVVYWSVYVDSWNKSKTVSQLQQCVSEVRKVRSKRNYLSESRPSAVVLYSWSINLKTDNHVRYKWSILSGFWRNIAFVKYVVDTTLNVTLLLEKIVYLFLFISWHLVKFYNTIHYFTYFYI